MPRTISKVNIDSIPPELESWINVLSEMHETQLRTFVHSQLKTSEARRQFEEETADMGSVALLQYAAQRMLLEQNKSLPPPSPSSQKLRPLPEGVDSGRYFVADMVGNVDLVELETDKLPPKTREAEKVSQALSKHLGNATQARKDPSLRQALNRGSIKTRHLPRQEDLDMVQELTEQDYAEQEGEEGTITVDTEIIIKKGGI